MYAPEDHGVANGALLTGKLRDEQGDLLTPTHATKKDRRHHYYVSNRLIAGGPDPSGWRLPARTLERMVINGIIVHLDRHAKQQAILANPDIRRSDAFDRILHDLKMSLKDRPDRIAGLPVNGMVRSGALHLALDGKALAGELSVEPSEIAPTLLSVEIPFTLRRRGVEMKIVAATVACHPDPTLLKTLFRAHGWARDLCAGRGITEIAQATGHSESFIRTRTQLAFLSPRLQRAILDGTHPSELTLKRMMRRPIPLDWDQQELLYGPIAT